jgi:clindamycin resistance transfer factor btgB
MHIDFAPPSGGTYNNAGSSRQLIAYLEHEDLERMEKGIYTDGFFNLTEDNIYKSKVIKEIDTNIGQLLKTDAKFFAIHVSPSENELRAMGNTEQEQAEAMKRYVREVFILEYAKNFNKGLSETDIKFYGNIHFDSNRFYNELNMHCHLIVSRKEQAGKKKLSPLTNHKNTKNGAIKGGFDRVNLFYQAEQGFDKLFSYDRQLSESFDYHNTMKNGSISEQLEIQNQNFTGEKKIETSQSCEKENMISCNLESTQNKEQSDSQKNNNQSSSMLSIYSLADGNNYGATLAEELQAQKRKKKKKKGIRR